ncbi:hypothetical protein [Arsukibacterium sp.]|uniref:hypothetical protein n=1 Tax=Arsukibacterium sp. TaxID=1977258 RepID=UPI002FDA6173
MQYNQFKAIATDCLKRWGLYSPAVVELMAMIVAHESMHGRYRRQINGPALGLFQIEPPTHDDIWQNGPGIKRRAAQFGIKQDVSQLEHSDEYSIFVARHHLMRDPNPIPTDAIAMAEYCKSYWNTVKGKATAEKYLRDWETWK